MKKRNQPAWRGRGEEKIREKWKTFLLFLYGMRRRKDTCIFGERSVINIHFDIKIEILILQIAGGGVAESEDFCEGNWRESEMMWKIVALCADEVDEIFHKGTLSEYFMAMAFQLEIVFFNPFYAKVARYDASRCNKLRE